MSLEDEETIHELAAEIEALRAETWMKWQPIETAPKDGTDILVRLSNGEVFRANNYAGLENSWLAGSDIGWVNARHWMPLPAPPSD